MKEVEIWKDIPDYEGMYQASTLGRIRDSNNVIVEVKRGAGNRPYLSNVGRIQDIVATTFLRKRPKDYDTCHGNGDTTNNKLLNLRYDTKHQNMLDRYRIDNNIRNEVCQIRELYNNGTYNQDGLARIYNCSRGRIDSIIKRKTFAYINDDGTIDDSTTAITYNSIITNIAKERAESHSVKTISLDDSILDFITIVTNKSA